MDDQRFDNLTRLFGSGMSRRQALRRMLGGAGALAGLSLLRPGDVGAAVCSGPGEGCDEDLLCCDALVCSTDGICGNCPEGQKFCADSLNCIAQSACCTDGDCTEPCTSCEGGTCTPHARYCESTQQCYNPGTDGCCPGIDECGECWECSMESTCQRIDDCCTGDDDCSELPCTSCQDNTCTPYAEFCPDGEYCYNHNMLDECCYDDECGTGRECTDRHCCPVGYDYCPDGDYCYTEREDECCTDDNCGEGVCVGKKCQQCPTGQSYCAATKTCYDPESQCCTDSECGPCAFCSELNNTCFGSCSQSQSCCHGVCVEDEVGCCQEFGDTCGVLDVASAGGDDRQYDCCDGLLCCFGQSTNVCGECCADSDCNAAWGGVCNKFICEYPTCEGKWEACEADSDCCHGLKCYDGVCKHRKHHHHPHPAPTPDKPVTTLPATGAKSGKSDSSSALGVTLATGAAALLAAKYLRQTSEDEATEEA